ncbi:hypothetical protein Tco_0849547 [Tanacetum coccineum]
MIQQRSYQAPVANHSLVAHHQSYQASDVHQPPQALFPRMDSRLVVLSFLPFDDPIASLNKAIAFINTIFTSQYPPTNNQLRTSSNPHNQATIRDGRVMVQIVQGRQTQGYTCSGARSNATMTGFNRNEGTNIAAWFKEKAMLAKALESGVVLDEEHMTFLADNGDTVTTAPSTSVVLMAKLSSYDSATLSEVPMHDNYLDNHVIDQNVQEMQYYEQPIFNNDTDIDLTSESNMISYEQYLKETENTVVQDTSSAQQEEMIMSVIEKMNNQVAKSNEVDKENKIINELLTAELERYKEQIKLFEERHKFNLNDREKYIDSQLRKVIVDKNAKVADFENQIYSLKPQLNATIESHKTLLTMVDGNLREKRINISKRSLN